jgi:hypothetical protein
MERCTAPGTYKPTPCGAPVGAENVTQHAAGRRCRAGDPNWSCWHDAVAAKTGGEWYSTTDDGYCGDGTAPAPDGCTWRVAKFVKRVNKTCSDNVIYDEVEKVDVGEGFIRFPLIPRFFGSINLCIHDCFLLIACLRLKCNSRPPFSHRRKRSIRCQFPSKHCVAAPSPGVNKKQPKRARVTHAVMVL